MRGIRHVRLHTRRAPADDSLAGRLTALQTLSRPSGSAENPGAAQLRPVARVFCGPGAIEVLPGDADASSRLACGQLLCLREGRRAGVHKRGRRGPVDIRCAGSDGDRQCPNASGRAAGADRPGGPGRHLAGGRGGHGGQDRQADIVQSGGDADRGRSAHTGSIPGAVAGGRDLPVRRRAGGLRERVRGGPEAEQRYPGTRRGDRPPGPRRPECHDAVQCLAGPFRGRHGRVRDRHPSGLGSSERAGTVAGRVPGYGEPRTTGSADLHQGLGPHRVAGVADPGPDRSAAVPPHHR